MEIPVAKGEILIYTKLTIYKILEETSSRSTST